MVVDADGAELTLALIENVQREDLTPVAEARALRQLRERHGFTQVQAAEALNKSERWARDRERLADLPEKVQEAFDAGAIPLEAAPEIAKVAEASPKAAEALAELVQDEDSVNEYDEPFNFARKGEVTSALGILAQEEKDLGVLVAAGHVIRLGDFDNTGLPEEKLDELEDKYDQLGRLDRYAHVGLRETDLDAARAFGCLVELDAEYRSVPYITDAEWLADRIGEALDEEIDALKKRKTAAKPLPGGAQGDEGLDEETLKAERRRQREEEEQRRVEARANNLEARPACRQGIPRAKALPRGGKAPGADGGG